MPQSLLIHSISLDIVPGIFEVEEAETWWCDGLYSLNIRQEQTGSSLEALDDLRDITNY